MKYFSDNEQGMPPCILTEINVAIWNLTICFSILPACTSILSYVSFTSNAKLAASPDGDKPLVPWRLIRLCLSL